MSGMPDLNTSTAARRRLGAIEAQRLALQAVDLTARPGESIADLKARRTANEDALLKLDVAFADTMVLLRELEATERASGIEPLKAKHADLVAQGKAANAKAIAMLTELEAVFRVLSTVKAESLALGSQAARLDGKLTVLIPSTEIENSMARVRRELNKTGGIFGTRAIQRLG